MNKKQKLLEIAQQLEELAYSWNDDVLKGAAQTIKSRAESVTSSETTNDEEDNSGGGGGGNHPKKPGNP